MCLIAVGILTYLFFFGEPNNFTRFQLNLAFLVSVLPAFILIGVLVWIYTLFLKFKTVTVSDATFRLWHYFKGLALPDAIEMVKTRLSSVMAMTSNIFMKRIRQLQFNNLMDPQSRARLVSFNLIYALNPTKEPLDLWNFDPELKPTAEMREISKAAEKMPTTLWMTEEQFQTLIACGRCTTCYSLLKYLWHRWESENQHSPIPVPKPDTPESPYYDIYTRLKAKWLELKANPQSSQNRERI